MMNFSTKLITKSAFFGLAVSALVSTTAMAHDADKAKGEKIGALASPESTEIKSLTCWEVVTLNPEDRISAMTLLYGYAIGTKGQAAISPQDTQVAIVTTMTDCVDKPDAKILDVMFEKISELEQ
jgi:hypothetical protein